MKIYMHDIRADIRYALPIDIIEGVSVRTSNALSKDGKLFIGHLLGESDEELLRTPGFGQGCLENLKRAYSKLHMPAPFQQYDISKVEIHGYEFHEFLGKTKPKAIAWYRSNVRRLSEIALVDVPGVNDDAKRIVAEFLLAQTHLKTAERLLLNEDFRQKFNACLSPLIEKFSGPV